MNIWVLARCFLDFCQDILGLRIVCRFVSYEEEAAVDIFPRHFEGLNHPHRILPRVIA